MTHRCLRTQTNDISSPAREGGAILIVVLMVLVVLSIIVAQFSFSMSINRMVALNAVESAQLAYMAQGGAEYTKNLLRVDRQRGEVDSYHDAWAKPNVPFDPPHKVEVTVTDECGKLNVNALILGSSLNMPMKEALERLFLELDINIEAVHRLADFIDPDEEGDMEDGAKNAPLDDLAELLSIEYITPDKFFSVGTGEERTRGLVEFLTVHGPGKVNINTAPPEVIMAIFGKAEYELGAFEDFRKENPIKTLEELPALGFQNALAAGPLIGFTSDYYRIFSRASSNRMTKTVEMMLIRGTRKVRVLEQRIF